MEIVGSIDVPFVLAWIVVPAVLVWFVWWIAKRARLGWGFWLLGVLASTVGWYSGFYVGIFGTLAVEAILPNYGGAVLWAGLGAGVGILQWFVLRWRVSRSGWWVLASILGLAVSMEATGFLSPNMAMAVGGVGLGAVTGLALVWLLRQPVPEA